MTPFGFPPQTYHCLLDEQPYYLTPARCFAAPEPGPLIVSPYCWFSWLGPLPPDRAARVVAAEKLYPSPAIVWVEDPGTRALWPYWVGAEYAEYFNGLFPGYGLPRELPPHAVWVMSHAGILTTPGAEERRRCAWLETVRDKSSRFARGYTLVDRLVPAFQLGALRRYFRFHTRAGTYALGDEQVARRHYAHNDDAARFFHAQLAGAVSDIAGTPVRPSYTYLAAYESGAVLERHTDREQCEYSITLCVDATPEPEHDPCPWPIELVIEDGALRVWQRIGEGLVYRGRHLPHSRETLPEQHSFTALLLHYVDHDFAGSLS
jgi:hypothetical protein